MIDEIKKYEELICELFQNEQIIKEFINNNQIYASLLGNKMFFRTQVNEAYAIFGHGSPEANKAEQDIDDNSKALIEFERENLGSILDRNEIIENEITELRKNCQNNYNPFEYYTSIIPTQEQVHAFFSSNHFNITKEMKMFGGAIVTRYTFMKKFDTNDDVEFIKNINPYLECNSIKNGKEFKKYSFYKDEYSVCFYDDLWHIHDGDDDIIFTNEDIQEVFQYFNMVR